MASHVPPPALRAPVVLLLALLTARAPAAAQAHAHGPGAGAGQEAPLRWGARATGMVTRAAPALAGETFVEGYLTRPVLAAEARLLAGRLTAVGMLNLEGVTLARGELTPGIWGEGYVDRRHPHTYLHELVVAGHVPLAGGTASLAAGRGFAPFGTDDPMARPFVKFPLNHHLAQLPERTVAIGAWRRGAVVVEAGLFTAAEPLRPSDLGSLDGLDDSGAARLTLLPRRGLELQASAATVAANPLLAGTGLDQAKYSVSARAEGPATGGAAYALLEWARTDERQGGRRVYTFESLLGEAALTRAPWTAALRLERSTRPEEDRLADPFRTPHPHGDPHLVGITRWLVLSARAGRRVELGPLRATTFLEGSWQRVEEVTGSIFDPVEQYGDDRHWHLSAGITLAGGMEHVRMGRYGAARPAGH